MTTKPTPCRKCWGEPVYDSFAGHWLACVKCGARTEPDAANDYAEALALWNEKNEVTE